LPGDVTTEELALIDDATGAINAELGAYGVRLVDVTRAYVVADAAIRIHLADTGDGGGAVDGVRGITDFGGDVTLIDTWNFYFGTDPSAVGRTSTTSRRLPPMSWGHAIGLGHSTDSSSVMYPSLGMGVARRELTANDLSVIDNIATGPSRYWRPVSLPLACGTRTSGPPLPLR
jgi:hypothetical protein